MPGRRARIAKTSAGWTVTRPRYGLGHDETWTAPTHRAAIRSLDRTIPRGGLGHPVDSERAWQPTDGIAALPAWSPLWVEED